MSGKDSFSAIVVGGIAGFIVTFLLALVLVSIDLHFLKLNLPKIMWYTISGIGSISYFTWKYYSGLNQKNIDEIKKGIEESKSYSEGVKKYAEDLHEQAMEAVEEHNMLNASFITQHNLFMISVKESFSETNQKINESNKNLQNSICELKDLIRKHVDKDDEAKVNLKYIKGKR